MSVKGQSLSIMSDPFTLLAQWHADSISGLKPLNNKGLKQL
jgi:hypothetical protein